MSDGERTFELLYHASFIQNEHDVFDLQLQSWNRAFDGDLYLIVSVNLYLFFFKSRGAKQQLLSHNVHIRLRMRDLSSVELPYQLRESLLLGLDTRITAVVEHLHFIEEEISEVVHFMGARLCLLDELDPFIDPAFLDQLLGDEVAIFLRSLVVLLSREDGRDMALNEVDHTGLALV